MTSLHKDRALLFFLFPLACTVRFYGIDFGLPHTECRPDESTLVYEALSFFSGDLNPHFFNYPTLYMYALFGLYILYFVFRFLSGHSTSDMLTEVAVSPTNFFLISRGLSALFGSITIFVLYSIARRLFDRKTARLSAFFAGICYLHVRDSHFGTTDVAMTFFTVCAVLYITRCYTDGTSREYCAAGLFTGLATSTKYGGALLAVPMVFAHLLRTVGHRRGTDGAATILSAFIGAAGQGRIWFYLLSAGVSFLLFTPFALFDFSQFAADFTFEMRHLAAGHGGLDLGRGWGYHLRYTLPFGMGWCLFLSSLIGVAMYAREDAGRALVLYLFPLAFYLSAGRGLTVFVRYMIPVLPFLCLSSAVFAARFSNMLTGWLPRGGIFQRAALPLVAAALSAQSVYTVFLFDRTISRVDSRVLAAAWIDGNLPAGSTLYHSGAIWGQAQPTPSVETLEDAYREAQRRGNRGRLLKARIAYYRKMEQPTGYREWKYDGEKSIREGPLPDYMVIYRSPLKIYSRVPDRIGALLESDYRLKKAFEAVDMDAPHRYDQIDAFYVPFAGFEGVVRPGPNIYIYARSKRT